LVIWWELSTIGWKNPKTLLGIKTLLCLYNFNNHEFSLGKAKLNELEREFPPVRLIPSPVVETE